MRALVMVCLIGCGRVGFDAGGGDAGGGGDSVTNADAPPLPASLVCSAKRFPIPELASGTQLAVEANGALGFTAMWIDHGAVVATRIDTNLAAEVVSTLIPGPVDELAGVFSTPMTTLFVTVSGTSQTLWSSPTLTSATVVRTETSVAAYAPVVTDATRIPRAWMRGSPGGLDATYVNSDGSLKSDALIPTSNPVTAVATADNSDHGHMTWAENDGSCHQADLDFISPNTPTFGGSALVSPDCVEPRIDSGPAATDSIITAWRTTARSLELRYHGGVFDRSGNLAARGRAPRIRFDGTRFWTTWIDESAGDVLRVATVEQDLTVTGVDLPGWVPAGDHAFELALGTDGVYLFVLGGDTLSVLRTCP